jgi:hypothetical protein
MQENEVKELTIEEKIELKCAELISIHKVKVVPYLGYDEDGSAVVGYIKEPPRHVKLMLMDKGISKPITAASDILDSCLIVEESDPRIMSNDKFYFGAVFVANNLIETALSQFKKK